MMAQPGQNPKYTPPEHEPSREEEYENQLDKSGLDLKNTDAALTAHEDETLARGIARLPIPAETPQTTEEDTPLQLFGIIAATLRRRQGLTLHAAAQRAGLDPGLLLALEVGAASLEQVSAVLKPLGDAYGAKYPYLSKVLAQLTLQNEE